MIYFCTGLPSLITNWCGSLLGGLLSEMYGTSEILNGQDDLSILGLNLIQSRASHSVVVSCQPRSSLINALVDYERPFITIIEDPRNAVRHLIKQQNYNIIDAARIVAQCCAPASEVLNEKFSMPVYAEAALTNPVETAAAIAAHFGLNCNSAVIASVISHVDPPSSSVLNQEPHDFSEAEWRLIDGALAPYAAYFRGEQITTFNWDRHFFFSNEQPSAEYAAMANKPIDISGRARRLIYGPYITLPAGYWTVSVSGIFSRHAAENGYRLAVTAGDNLLKSVTFNPSPDIIMKATIDFFNEHPFDNFIEICLEMDRAAIGGTVTLINTMVCRSPVGVT